MIAVAGGLYGERCRYPPTERLLGSGGRSAVALAAVSNAVSLHTYVSPGELLDARTLGNYIGFELHDVSRPEPILFDYLHGLATPKITPEHSQLESLPEIRCAADVVLRFGTLEGRIVVSGDRVVYDPQSPVAPEWFRENGSTADHLAVAINAHEARLLTGEDEPAAAAAVIAERDGAEVVLVKHGPQGVGVWQAGRISVFPAWQTPRVFKIGSGDIFAAAFAHHWAERRRVVSEAAEAATRAVARYCASGSVPLATCEEPALEFPVAKWSRGRVYLAGPFFTMAERWLVEEARQHLSALGHSVFSPLHDVGRGPAHLVAPEDIRGLTACDRVLALVDGADPGTLFEVGYARAMQKPVVALAEHLPERDRTMIEGSGCVVVDDFVTALYQVGWC